MADADTDTGADGAEKTRKTARHARVLRVRLAQLQKRIPARLRIADGIRHGIMSATAALIAYLPTQALGLREGFWGAITAIAVVQSEYSATRTTARDQFAGAAIGGIVGVAVALTVGQHVLSFAGAVILSMAACWLLNVATASRLAGITSAILLLVPHTGTVEAMMVSRVGEVAWGVAVATATVWAISRIGRQNPAGQIE